MASYTSFLGLRYGFSRQRSRFTALVSMASMLGMMLGVASLITVLSVMNGFAGELRGRILALIPHAYVELLPAQDSKKGEESARATEALSSDLLADPRILAIAPFVRETVLFSGPYRQQGAVLTGIDISRQSALTELEDFLRVGRLEDLREDFTVILGSSMARMLGVVPGDELRIVLPQVSVTPLGLFPRSRLLTVVGLFEVGAQQDSMLAYVSLPTANRLLKTGGTRGLQLRTSDLMTAPTLGAALDPVLQGRGVYRPWSETQGSLFRAIRMEKLTVSILLLGVVLVAAFNVVSTLVMAVTEKRRDIAVLRTMGATPGDISLIFLTQGLALALLGVMAGAAAGSLLSVYVADLVDFFERLFGARIFDPSVYFISRLPSELLWTDVLAVSAAAAMLSVLAAIYPAWRASRIAPAEVLRYE
ncbi:lipoprotein-releasing ABC transporter permease subunit [Congregibacter litoralis]|uniref:Lipoprotein releasing system, transmembrane protein, LolC/E family n=1 Tax=Congregibacter litoralis KT71 TaxID=314285 RepID=A4A8A0_9GAMM|nr:lipoprotein-releasing ABC transporter permease subunit [Congregibacter litoralis]EAQ97895.1 lipoprotein releasing system, transmembrane protein, LolC/E family [Congregibacter litoralis KT71]